MAGARCIELKTVQIMYGEELGIPRPCIYSVDEAYNVEWSSEYSCDEAADEYIKAWFALKLISKELGLGDPDGFLFIMSVGYNLAGIKSLWLISSSIQCAVHPSLLCGILANSGAWIM